ncbi:potassium transporter KefB [Pontibacter sp. 172403-2]|uniref:potassium transporter KefB n=1 Tax=Pontibacter rufus TaxID=2791028 RepID=UPI0018AF8D55|nr:potassium transporter KefB [Pontibacter sp. 172403-2]MBF9251945.1 potassium transporter KefB [Pontibacter sp. 172403-2]
MTQKNNLKVFPIKSASLIKRMLLGALIGLILISIFLLGAGDPNPEWGKLWMIRPLIIVPLAGAMGGAFNYFINQQDFRNGWAKILAIILSIIVFIIGLWLGTVLGLDGTYWD